jgi:hypothetical protein
MLIMYLYLYEIIQELKKTELMEFQKMQLIFTWVPQLPPTLIT